MNKNKLYLFILFACFVGYSWLLFSLQHEHEIQSQEFTVCLFKKVTTVPCPSCGTTRSVMQLSHGIIISAILINPFGIIVGLIMLVAPVWIGYDFIHKKETFYTAYLKIETILRKRKVAIVFFILVIANWIWNIKKKSMITTTKFNYQPHDSELERASNSYLMSLVAVIGGLPLPILNLMASVFFYLGNRKSTAFVKWHCTQALVSQLGLFFFNSAGFWWTVSILFYDETATNYYFAYILTLIVFNLIEFFSTLIIATKVRKGQHTEFFFFGDVTKLICRTNESIK